MKLFLVAIVFAAVSIQPEGAIAQAPTQPPAQPAGGRPPGASQPRPAPTPGQTAAQGASPYDRDALTPDYRIAPGDALQIFVWKEPDLSREVRVDRTDELGKLQQALGGMRDGLADMVTKAHEGADSVQTAAAEIASGNMDLSQRTERTAGHVQQTTSALKDLGVAVRHTFRRPCRAGLEGP